MGKPLNTIPVTDLGQDAVKVLSQIRETKKPVVITEKGKAAAVLINIETYRQSEHDLKLLRLLAIGEREIEAEQGFDLDSVLAEADALLDRDS